MGWKFWNKEYKSQKNDDFGFSSIDHEKATAHSCHFLISTNFLFPTVFHYALNRAPALVLRLSYGTQY